MDSATLWTKEIYAGFQSKLTPILSRADPGEPNPLLFRPSLSTSLSPSPSRLHRPSPLSSSSFSPSLFLSTFPSPLLHSPRRQHGGALPPPNPVGREVLVRRRRAPLRQIWREGRRRPGDGPWLETAGGGGTEVARTGSGGAASAGGETTSVVGGSISPPPSLFVICWRCILVHVRVHLLL